MTLLLFFTDSLLLGAQGLPLAEPLVSLEIARH